MIGLVYGVTGTLILLCFGFLFVTVQSNKRKLQMQEEKTLEIRRSEQKYKTLFHHSLAGMIKFRYDPFEILDANEALLEILLCDTIDSLYIMLTQTASHHLAHVVSVLERSGILEEYEFSFIDKLGNLRWVLISVNSDKSDKTAYGVFRDITRRKYDQEKI